MSSYLTPTSPRQTPGALASGGTSPRVLTPIERDVVLTLAYADMFDYPLTLPEIHRYLVGTAAELAEVTTAVNGLEGRGIERRDGYVFVAGRRHTVDMRLRRRRSSAPRWDKARRYAWALSRCPFVRMVAVCGSLAVDNVDDHGDIDIFCITVRGRLWWGQVAAMLLRRLPAFARQHVCPNFFLSAGSLRLDDRNLYTAHEIIQAAPLAGEAVYREFVDANDWLDELLPNARGADVDTIGGAADEPGGGPRGDHQRRGAAFIERLFGGRFGDALDRIGYETLLRYYALRLRARGVTLQQLRRYYRRDRQLVVGGGYEAIVRSRFAAHLRELLGDPGAAAMVARLLPVGEASATNGPGSRPSQPLYEQQFETRYGADR